MPTPSDLVLAAGLLLAPAGTVDPIPSEDRWPAVSAALIQAGVNLEILDEREGNGHWINFGEEAEPYFTSREHFQADLDSIRNRKPDLDTCPRLADGAWLPAHQSAVALSHYWSTRAAKFRQLAAWHTDRADQYQPHIATADQRFHLWEEIAYSKAEHIYIPARRESLRAVRKLIGDDAWNVRRLPQPDEY